MPVPLNEGLSERRQQLPDEVASYVRELVLSGTVRPGEFLRMDRIANAVGVSNTPVREGLLTLSNEGFVLQVPRRGFVVAPFTRQDIRDLFWTQARLAGELAARAAKKISSEQADRARRIHVVYEATASAGTHDERKIADLGHAFHREINRAADSTRLAALLGSVVKNLPPRFYATIQGGVEAALEEHVALLDAMTARDARKTRRLMTEHIAHGADRLIANLERRGVWEEKPVA